MCSVEQQRVLRLSCLWAAEVLVPFASCQPFWMFSFERERSLWLCCFVDCCIKSLDALPIVEVFRCPASNGKGSCGCVDLWVAEEFKTLPIVTFLNVLPRTEKDSAAECFAVCCIKPLDALPIVKVFRRAASNCQGSCG